MENKTLEEQFVEFKEQIKELKEKLTHTGEQFLIKNFKDIFEKYPQLKSVSWTAYTPYFNDGETCEYSSHHHDPEFEADGVEYNQPIYSEIRNSLKKFLSQFDSDLMYELFGDHVQLIVTKEGISVEEYDHD